eukprot:GHVL01044625.1.p2 GENE.GHVL01044625.1~~GHVL01044625.1.p2  ORF type:complete len:361 (+),score=65.06 GHVL01044625.1:18-1100(+)
MLALTRILFQANESSGAHAVRKLIRPFLKLVHPDVCQNFPSEALNINEGSLKELNHYIDRLTVFSSDGNPVPCKNLQFFRPFITKQNKRIDSMVQQVWVELPPIPPKADFMEREYISTIVIRNLCDVAESIDSLFSSKVNPDPLFTPKDLTVNKLKTLWKRESNRVMWEMNIHEPDEKTQRLVENMQEFTLRKTAQMTAKALRIRNPSRQKKRLKQLNGRLRSLKMEKFGFADEKDAVPKIYGGEGKDDFNSMKTNLLKKGFRPDLVFVDPALSHEEKKIAIENICGMSLENESDIWLLQNVWEVMRKPPVAVPLVVGPETIYAASDSFITLCELVDFLEENLDIVRQKRLALLNDRKAV